MIRFREMGILFSAFFLFCSTDSGTLTGSSSLPVISNLQFSPQTSSVGQGGGAVTIIGTINFVSTGGGGDITTILASSNAKIISTTILNISGQQSGVITFSVEVSTETAGFYTLNISVVDSQGSQSNTVSGTFVVS